MSATTSDRMLALEKANRIRIDAATVRHAVMDGRMTVADALWDEDAGSLPILTLLTAQRRWGTVRARKLLNRLRIGHTRRVRELTDRQRRAIVAGIHGEFEELAA